MAGRRTWWSITVELIEGRGESLWPRPGRRFAVAKHHTFERFAVAIDDAFARWDRALLHQFELFPDAADYRTRPELVARPDARGRNQVDVMDVTRMDSRRLSQWTRDERDRPVTREALWPRSPSPRRSPW